MPINILFIVPFNNLLLSSGIGSPNKLENLFEEFEDEIPLQLLLKTLEPEAVDEANPDLGIEAIALPLSAPIYLFTIFFSFLYDLKK